MCLKYLTTKILLWERSEKEKERRRKFGDNGAKFKVGKIPKLAPPGVLGTITTMVTKDILLAEIYETASDQPAERPDR